MKGGRSITKDLV